MRVVLPLALFLALVPAASSFNGELPGDVEDCAPGDAQRVVQRYVSAFAAICAASGDSISVWSVGPPRRG